MPDVPLRELSAKLVHSTTEGWREVDAMADADGVIFDCPGCREHSVLVFFEDAPANPFPANPGGKRWQHTGTGLDDLTTTPSIHLLSGCRWHGWLRDGAAVG